MRRGTTPTHSFTVPFEIPEGSAIRIVYSQNDVILFEHTTESCTVEGNKVTVRLTDEETLRIDAEPHYIEDRYEPYMVEMQIGVRTPGDDKMWSDYMYDTPEGIIRKDGVI